MSRNDIVEPWARIGGGIPKLSCPMSKRNILFFGEIPGEAKVGRKIVSCTVDKSVDNHTRGVQIKCIRLGRRV